MIGQYQVSAARNEQAAFAFDAHLPKLLKLGVERTRIDDYPVADHTGAFVVEDSRRNEAEDELSVAYADGMARVVAALIAGDDVEMRREYVDDLTLAFVAPLGAHYNDVFHFSPLARKPAACATKQAAGAGFVSRRWRRREGPAPKQTCRRTLLVAMCAPAFSVKLALTAVQEALPRARSIMRAMLSFDVAPTIRSASTPLLNRIKVGMPFIPQF